MTKVAVNAPKTPVTEGSSGVAAATLPNVCKMPGPPAPFVPTPLPNIGKSGSSPKDYTKTVTIGGKKVAIRGATFGSMGDVASKGTGGGIVSANVEGPTSFAGPGSMDVKMDGKNVQLLGDPMLNNCGPGGSPANSATLMGVIQVPSGLVTLVTGKEPCPLCEKEHGAESELKETDQTRADAEKLANTLTEYNAGAALTKKFPKGENDAGRMLGVVRCLCNQTYADHSSGTEPVFRELVPSKHGWHVPGQGGNDVSIAGTPVKRVLNTARRRCTDEKGNVDVAKATKLEAQWATALQLFSEYEVAQKERKDPSRPARFPPGSCAGPKALALALDDGALLSGITERWFHRGMKDTEGGVEHLRSDQENSIIKSFGHGESVPPCGTCNIVLPLLLCTDDKKKADKCNHKKKKT
jgi:hypothetical protein